jgi:hypothetical protein
VFSRPVRAKTRVAAWRINYPTGPAPRSAAVANANEDGIPDLVVVNAGTSTVSLLIGNGNGTFQAKLDYPTSATPGSIAVADVSGDGKLDFVVTSAGTATVSVLLATCLP